MSVPGYLRIGDIGVGSPTFAGWTRGVPGSTSSSSRVARVESYTNDTGWSFCKLVPITLVSPVEIPEPTGIVPLPPEGDCPVGYNISIGENEVPDPGRFTKDPSAMVPS